MTETHIPVHIGSSIFHPQGVSNNYTLEAYNSSPIIYPSVIDSVAIWKFTVQIMGEMPPEGDALLIGYSNKAADSNSIAPILDAWADKFINSLGTGHPMGSGNCFMINVNNRKIDEVIGAVDLIKTICGRTVIMPSLKFNILSSE